MPRFAFAVPFLPQQRRQWRATADEILVRHASEHRQFLLSRGIYKERWWVQTGRGTPPLTLVLLDCDDIGRVTSGGGLPVTPHERWLGSEVIEGIHGIRPAHTFTLPPTELLSGTTTMATATAETQTMFALPLPPEAIGPVRSLIARIEHGDMAQAHGRFLADARIREEWIWLQQPHASGPPLLLIHWIGDDLDDAWQRLTFVRDDEYARMLHEALFTRLVGIGPEQVSHWAIDQLMAMHVRRSDSRSGVQERLARRLFAAIAKGATESVADLLVVDVQFRGADGLATNGRDAVVAALNQLAEPGPGDAGAQGAELRDVLAGDTHVLGLLGTPADATLPLLARVIGGRIVHLEVLGAPAA